MLVRVVVGVGVRITQASSGPWGSSLPGSWLHHIGVDTLPGRPVTWFSRQCFFRNNCHESIDSSVAFICAHSWKRGRAWSLARCNGRRFERPLVHGFGLSFKSWICCLRRALYASLCGSAQRVAQCIGLCVAHAVFLRESSSGLAYGNPHHQWFWSESFISGSPLLVWWSFERVCVYTVFCKSLCLRRMYNASPWRSTKRYTNILATLNRSIISIEPINANCQLIGGRFIEIHDCKTWQQANLLLGWFVHPVPIA